MSDGQTLLAVVFLATGVPVLLVALAEMYKRHVAFKERRLELTAAEATAQVKQLEERMRVLERIATDKGADLAQRIEDLRDEPLRIADKELSR